MKLIDLSVTLKHNEKWAPKWARNKISYQSHRFGALVIRILFNLPGRLLKKGLGWANDVITLSTHGTTHVDAPWHFAPEINGKPARTIDQMPLDWFYRPGVVLDMRSKKHGEKIMVQDVKNELEKINHKLRPQEIVLIMTGSDKLLGKSDYFNSGPGVSAEATEWLIDQGITVMGIDAWGWDRPLPVQAEEARKSNNKTLFWEAHFVGMKKEYCHMERLTNLDKLPPKGFTVSCFPLKINKASAGPARVVALLNEN